MRHLPAALSALQEVAMAELGGAGSDLDRWLEPFLAALGHKKRRTWAPLYLRGLLGPGERKSLQPMAGRPGARGLRAAALVAPGPAGPARPGRAQEPAAEGGPPRAVRARPAAALHRQPGLGRRPAVAGTRRAVWPGGGRGGARAGGRARGA